MQPTLTARHHLQPLQYTGDLYQQKQQGKFHWFTAWLPVCLIACLHSVHHCCVLHNESVSNNNVLQHSAHLLTANVCSASLTCSWGMLRGLAVKNLLSS